jgi:hypothetical protein
VSSPKIRQPHVFPPETKLSILKAIQNSGKPLKPAEIAKTAESERKVPAARIKALLAEDLASGSLFNWGSEKQPAYWHRDPAEAQDRLSAVAASNVLAKRTCSAGGSGFAQTHSESSGIGLQGAR